MTTLTTAATAPECEAVAVAKESPRIRPGRWIERGYDQPLVILDAPATTPGMVLVAFARENWPEHPERCWQTFPEELSPWPL